MIEKFAIFGGLGFVFVSVGFLLKGATIHPSSFAIGTIVSLITQILVMRRYVSFIRKGKGSKCWTWNTILNQYISVAIAIAAFAGLFAAAGSTGLERIPFPSSTSIKAARVVVSILAGLPSYKYLNDILAEKTVIYRPEWKRD